MECRIRDAHAGDLPAIQAIYAGEVLEGTASFELDPPDLAEFTRRFAALRQAGYPYLVAEAGAGLAGYAYAGAYRARPAYRYTVEDSIYLAPWARGQGLGRALLGALIERCEGDGFRQMVAVIGDSAHRASIALHRSAGFQDAGVLRDVGFKFGRWLDTVQMQRALGPGADSPPR